MIFQTYMVFLRGIVINKRDAEFIMMNNKIIIFTQRRKESQLDYVITASI